MKKILFGICVSLVLCASPSLAADWVPIVESENVVMYLMLDPAYIILHSTNKPKAWVMTDIKTKDRDYDSSLVLEEYDCVEKKVRALSRLRYRGHMGEDGIVWSSSLAGDWNYLIPGTIGYKVSLVVCEADELFKKTHK